MSHSTHPSPSQTPHQSPHLSPRQSPVKSSSEKNLELIYKTKLNKLIRNQGWNTVLDKELVNYQQKAWCYKRLHQLSANYYNNLDWVLTILIMSASISSLFSENDDYIYVIFTVITTILVGFQKMAAYSRLEQQHLSAHNNYGKYVTQLRNMLKLYRRDRPYAKQYIEFISGAYDDLAMRGPPISGFIIKSFQHYYKNPKILMPDILSDNIDLLEKGIDGSDTVSDDIEPITLKQISNPADDDSEHSDKEDNNHPQDSLDRRRAYEISRLHAQNTFMTLNFT